MLTLHIDWDFFGDFFVLFGGFFDMGKPTWNEN